MTKKDITLNLVYTVLEIVLFQLLIIWLVMKNVKKLREIGGSE